MKSNLIQAFALIAVLAATMGTAFAMWSETLLVNVDVYTGEVDVAFTDWICSDIGPDPQAPGFSNAEGKDVASCAVDVEVLDNEGDVIKLLVTITNAYPGYAVDVNMSITNIGTIPVKLYSYGITGLNTTALAASLTFPADTQIDPGDTHIYTLHIEVLQEADELSTYSFEVSMTFAQWNEVPSGG